MMKKKIIKKPKILFIAPLPPPITGQSTISGILSDELEKEYYVIKINYARKDVKYVSGPRFSQFKNVVELSKIINKNRDASCVYLTISQSFLGNIKDLFFLLKMGKKLREKTVIHLHGGNFDVYYRKTFFIVRLLNKFLFADISKGIVLGRSLIRCLMPVIPTNKIEIVENFFDDDLLIDLKMLNKKWEKPKKLNILFLSNMMEEKGYTELLEGFLELPEKLKSVFNLTFAGEFPKKKEKHTFLQRVKGIKNIMYPGVISGNIKAEILKSSHVFFLPSYSMEGQPVSILEAYASGLCVFTTNKGGIVDIFKDKVNGEFIEKKSASSIRNSLMCLVKNVKRYKEYAFFNRKYAVKFSKDKFIKNMKRIINNATR